MSVIRELSKQLMLDEDDFRTKIDEGRKHIKIYKVRKRNGTGHRKIAVPPRIFKLVQYWTIKNILQVLPISDYATAFAPGSSIRKNAQKHKEGGYFVRLDIKEFFPSIAAEDLFQTTSNITDSAVQMLNESKADVDFLSCLFLKERCAIGYPVSPYIANIVLSGIDEEISERLQAREEDFGKSTYTRYADDMTISIERKGFKKEVVEIVAEVLGNSEYPKLNLNKDKTRYGSRVGGGAFVTGLRICPDGRIVLHRKYKDHIRLLMSLESKGQLKAGDRASLRGHLSYCSFADPAFFTRLATKHVEIFDSLIGPGNK